MTAGLPLVLCTPILVRTTRNSRGQELACNLRPPIIVLNHTGNISMFAKRFSILAVMSVAFSMIDATEGCQAAVTFLGPTPYLSKADSPFLMAGSNPNFFLEDFEDGLFNTPGIVLPTNPEARGIVLPAGQVFTNSVDKDDGQIDDMGRNARALMSTVYSTNLLDPPIYTSYISFSFDADQIGFLPTEFGFVWTYGQQGSIVRLDVFDGNSIDVGFKIFAGIGNGVDNDTSDDRFFGFQSSEGIRSVLIATTYPGDLAFFEIDHVQFGMTIPEPSSYGLIQFLFSILILRYCPLRM